MKTVTPYQHPGKSKKQQVAEMFDNIAGRYDFLNHFLSLGIDVLWRKKAIRTLRKKFIGNLQSLQILDIATGTGDFAIEAVSLHPAKITGIDISEKMLAEGQLKIQKKGLENNIELLKADSENMPFNDNTFDAITVGFGVRNFEHLDKGLQEMLRVLKKNGKVFILEFSQPEKFPVKQLYHFYFKNILPVTGKILSSDARAYTYLPESVFAFPFGKAFVKKMEDCGFTGVQCIPLSFGIATLYTAEK